MLTIANTSHDWQPNAVDNTVSSLQSANAPGWRVSNLTAGTLINLGTGNNASDVGYNRFTKRFGFIRNNFATISEISEADIVNGVANPTIIRRITINGLGGFNDTEGLSNVFPNLLEGGYEFWMSIENGGRNWAYNVPITESEMFGTTDISITQRQRLQMAANSTGTNDALEGVDFNLATNQIIACQEGATSERKIFLADRPTDRDSDLDEAIDAGFTVTNPFIADTVIPAGSDCSSICFHPGTGHILVLSDTGNAVRQYELDGTLIDTLTVTGMNQIEGICLHGDNLVIMGEADECRYYTYVAA